MARAALTGFGDHARLTVRLTPNGGRDAIVGFETAADGEEHLKVRVRAVPEKGKANEALIALLAKALGLARNRIAFVSGDTQRKKILRIEADPEAILKRLGELVAE
ncbi:DUF167 family protein [Sinorhizobium fredii]|uniref:DUF167 family protein n=1 Tax=Rhizobium fredii TaxID=380 RepID=UPI0004B1429C|nr:DUF167 family protein [Sinorhizobium fredii]ASY70800.1 hypothetical protein SF83666_c34040 [Sinorhizobium fredii CCBAU 83666]